MSKSRKKDLTPAQMANIKKIYRTTDISQQGLAEKYGVSKNRIANIIYDRIKTDGSPRIDKGKKKGVEGINEILMDVDTPVMLELQCKKVLHILDDSKKVEFADRIRAIEQVTRTKRILQEMEIESYIKRADAEIIARIIREFVPDASDSQVIKIYKKHFEAWKAERQK